MKKEKRSRRQHIDEKRAAKKQREQRCRTDHDQAWANPKRQILRGDNPRDRRQGDANEWLSVDGGTFHDKTGGALL